MPGGCPCTKTPNFHAIGPRLTSMKRGKVPLFDPLMKIVHAAEKSSRIEILGHNGRKLFSVLSRAGLLPYTLFLLDLIQHLSRIIRGNKLVVFRLRYGALKSLRNLLGASHSCFHLLARIVRTIGTVVQTSLKDARTNCAVFFRKIRAAALVCQTAVAHDFFWRHVKPEIFRPSGCRPHLIFRAPVVIDVCRTQVTSESTASNHFCHVRSLQRPASAWSGSLLAVRVYAKYRFSFCHLFLLLPYASHIKGPMC